MFIPQNNLEYLLNTLHKRMSEITNVEYERKIYPYLYRDNPNLEESVEYEKITFFIEKKNVR